MRRLHRPLLATSVVSTLPIVLAAPQSTNVALPSNLIVAVPACVQDCLLNYAANAATAGGCGYRPSLGCLCAISNLQYTLGEAAQLCLGNRCPFETSADPRLQYEVGAICQGQPGAVQGTHTALVITRTPSPASSIPSSSPSDTKMSESTISVLDVPTTAPPPPPSTFTTSNAPTSRTSSSSTTPPSTIDSRLAASPTNSRVGSNQTSQAAAASTTSSPKLASGAIAGIVGGSVLGVCLLVGAILWCCFLRSRRKERLEKEKQDRLDSKSKRRLSGGSDQSLTSFSQPNESAFYYNAPSKSQQSLPPHPGAMRQTVWPSPSPSSNTYGAPHALGTPTTPKSYHGSTRTVSGLLPPKPEIDDTPPIPVLSEWAPRKPTPAPRSFYDSSYGAGGESSRTPHEVPSPKVPPKDPKYNPRGSMYPSNFGASRGASAASSLRNFPRPNPSSHTSSLLPNSRHASTALPHIVTAVATSKPVNFSQPSSVKRANTAASSIYSGPSVASHPRNSSRDLPESLPAVPAPLRIRSSQQTLRGEGVGLPPTTRPSRSLAPPDLTFSQASTSSDRSQPMAPHPSPALVAPSNFAKLSPSQPQYGTYSPYSPDMGGISPEDKFPSGKKRLSISSDHTDIEDESVFEATGLKPVAEIPASHVEYPPIPPSGSPPLGGNEKIGARTAWGQPNQHYAPRREDIYYDGYDHGQF